MNKPGLTVSLIKTTAQILIKQSSKTLLLPLVWSRKLKLRTQFAG